MYSSVCTNKARRMYSRGHQRSGGGRLSLVYLWYSDVYSRGSTDICLTTSQCCCIVGGGAADNNALRGGHLYHTDVGLRLLGARVKYP